MPPLIHSREFPVGRKTRPRLGIGKSIPDMPVSATGNLNIRLGKLRGKPLVLYFYPKDDTSGCTLEGLDFRDRHIRFRKLGAAVFGVSRDSLALHEKFKVKHGFPFELISDPDEKLCRAFDVIKKKSLYGRSYMGIDRSTFIFDKKGMLRHEFHGVKVPGHVDQVLDAVNQL